MPAAPYGLPYLFGDEGAALHGRVGRRVRAPKVYSPYVLEGKFPELRPCGILRSSHSPGPLRRSDDLALWHRTARRVYSWGMLDEDAVLEEQMGNLGEASGRIRASRRLLLEHALADDPAYLRLAARLSEALEVTETASREARRLRDAG